MSSSPAQHRDDDEALRRLDPVRDLPQLQAEAAAAPDPVQLPAADGCSLCDGVGWLTTAVPIGHPDFAKLIACDCTKARQAQQKAAELVQLSNLTAFHNKTFATFNPFIAGLRDVVPKIVTYARNPQG